MGTVDATTCHAVIIRYVYWIRYRPLAFYLYIKSHSSLPKQGCFSILKNFLFNAIDVSRDPLSGATGITHAGYCNENVLKVLCEKVCQLSGVKPPCHTAQFVPNHQPPSNRQGVGGGLNHHLDLYIIGGYEDEQGHSQRLSMHLLSFLQRLPYPLDLRVCCIGKHNTKMARVSGRTGLVTNILLL